MTTHSPRRSTASTKRRSSIGAGRGAASRPSSSPPSNGSIGSTTDASSSRSEISLPQRLKRATMPKPRVTPSPRDSNQTASGKPGAVHFVGGRVGDWRAGLGRCLCSPLARSFVRECHIISTMPRFQPPPRRTQHADFPHCAHLFASPQGLWDLSCRSRFRLGSYNAIAVEEAQLVVHPLPIPPLPIEAPTIPSALHMAPDLLFHPVFDEAEALAGMPDREVIHPST